MRIIGTIFLSLLGISTSFSSQVTAKIYSTTSKTFVGEIIFADSPFGLIITPNLTGLPAGPHGFHLHQHPNCGDVGMEAGGHFDPKKTNTHLGPYGEGHLGDLPVIIVTADGHANTPLLAPRLKVDDLKKLAVMLHAGGDNYSDNPKLGGGGDRIGCGIIEPKFGS
jgi:Cu-Zn family superoxide dismutase